MEKCLKLQREAKTDGHVVEGQQHHRHHVESTQFATFKDGHGFS